MEEDASEFGDWEVLATGDGDGEEEEEEAFSGVVSVAGNILSDHFAVVSPPAASSSSSGDSWAEADEDHDDEEVVDYVGVVVGAIPEVLLVSRVGLEGVRSGRRGTGESLDFGAGDGYDRSERGELEVRDLVSQVDLEGIGLGHREAAERLDFDATEGVLESEREQLEQLISQTGGLEGIGLRHQETEQSLDFDAIKASDGSEREELEQVKSVSQASLEGISSGNHESAESFDLDGIEVANDASKREELEQVPLEGIDMGHHDVIKEFDGSETEQLEERDSVPQVHFDGTSPRHFETKENLNTAAITVSSEAERDQEKQESLDLEGILSTDDDDASQREQTGTGVIGSGNFEAGAGSDSVIEQAKHAALTCGELEEVRDGSLPLVESAAAASEGEKRGVVWWKLPLGLLKYCACKVKPVWSISIAAALVGLVMLGRRMYKMRRKSRSIPQIKIAIDDKRASQFAARAARLNEAFLMVRRVPVIRTSSGAVVPWSMVQER